NEMYNFVIDIVPMLFIETIILSIVLITLLIIVFQQTETAQLVATMALFAMAAFRIMPSINRVISLMSSIRYTQPALEIVYDDLFVHETESYGSNRDLTKVNRGERNFVDK